LGTGSPWQDVAVLELAPGAFPSPPNAGGSALSRDACARSDVGEDVEGTHTYDVGIEGYEQFVRFLDHLGDLIRVTHVDAYDQLRRIDEAIGFAIGDSPNAAIEFVHDVVLSRFQP
jgi:hypothetical protein